MPMRVAQLIKEAESLSEDELSRLIARLMVLRMREDEPEWTDHQMTSEEAEVEV